MTDPSPQRIVLKQQNVMKSLRPKVAPLARKEFSREEKVERLSKLREVSKDVESMFVGMIVKAMRQAGTKSNYPKKSVGMDVYDSIADQQLSIFLSQKRGLGLGQSVFNQLVRREGLEDLAVEITDPSRPYEKIVLPSQLRNNGLVMKSSPSSPSANQ